MWFLYQAKSQNEVKQGTVAGQSTEASNPYRDANLTWELIPSENNTWGYKIVLEGSPMIIQASKPGLPGNEGFKTREQAQKLAEFVMAKIRNGQMPPTVSIEDLQRMNALH